MLAFKVIYKDLKEYAYGSYLRDAKRGRNPSRSHGHFGLHVLLKLFYLDF